MLRSRLRAKQGTTSPRFGPLGQHDALHRAAATFHPDDRLVAKIYAIDIPLLHYDVLPVPGHRSRCCRGRGRPLWHRVPFRHNRSDMRLRGAPAIRHRRPASGPGARPCARPHRSSGAFGGGVHSSNASRAQPNPQIRVCEIRRHFQAILGTGIGGVLLIRYQARIFLFAEQYRGALRRGGDDVASLCVLIGACPGPPEHRLRKLAKAKTIGCWQFHSSRTRNHVSATVYRGLPAMVRIGPHARSWLIAIPAKLAMTFFSHTFLRLRTSGSLCKAAYVVRAGRRLLTGACNQRASASSSCKVVTFVPQALHLALRRRLRMLPSAVLLTARCTAQPESPSVPNSRQKKKVHKRSQQLAPRLPGKTGIVLHMLWLLLRDGAVLQVAERRKRSAYPELAQGSVQSLCVLGCAISGRWNASGMSIVRRLPPHSLCDMLAERAPHGEHLLCSGRRRVGRGAGTRACRPGQPASADRPKHGTSATILATGRKKNDISFDHATHLHTRDLD